MPSWGVKQKPVISLLFLFICKLGKETTVWFKILPKWPWSLPNEKTSFAFTLSVKDILSFFSNLSIEQLKIRLKNKNNFHFYNAGILNVPGIQNLIIYGIPESNSFFELNEKVVPYLREIEKVEIFPFDI